MDNSKWMPLSNVDDEEIWVGARVRVYNVGMNREIKKIISMNILFLISTTTLTTYN